MTVVLEPYVGHVLMFCLWVFLGQVATRTAERTINDKKIVFWCAIVCALAFAAMSFWHAFSAFDSFYGWGVRA